MSGENYINHIALVLDASSSMQTRTRELVRVADAEIRHLATRSQELDQETRVTVYVFDDDVRCLIYDKDVLRLPSLEGLYRAEGNTALIAATVKALDDLAETPQRYGDHAFLAYVLTDGQENVSRWSTVFGGDGRRRWDLRGAARYTLDELVVKLRGRLDGLAENWTVAALVPDVHSAHEAKRFGFPANNVAIWDASRAEGTQEVFSATIRTATETFMVGRSKGVRGSKTLFAGGADQVNAQARKAAGLRVVPKSEYALYDVKVDGVQIRSFVETATNAGYRTGSAFYQLHTVLGGTKTAEVVQPQKKIVVRNRKSGRVYAGAQARQLLGLPADAEVRVRPEDNPEYQIFVQSTSVNRKLVAGTKLLVLAEGATL